MYQMKEAILCKYGEVILKGTNKKTFENQLMNEVRRRAALVGNYTVRYNQSTVYVEPNDEEAEDMLDVMYAQIGKVFGFDFLENFDYPYISGSVTEFWRRWHMSLGTWFRDYVYIPLGGNRGGRFKQYRNLLVVWMLTGIWHGANWNYVLWGLSYALLLMVEKAFLEK